MRIAPIKVPLSSRSLQNVVPGAYPQVEQDLAAFPEPVLDALDRYGARVAVLDDGESLFDSPALRTLSEQEYNAEKSQANRIVRTALPEIQASSVEELTDSLTRELRKAGLDFHLGLSRETPNLEQIAARQNIPEEHFQDWVQSFHQLNKELPEGLLLLPHTYHQGKPIPHNLLRNSKEVTAEFVERSLGINRAEDRLVLLHKKFTPENAVEIGNYRLAIHETGHALDHLLDTMTGLPGLGAAHRATVDALYQKDLKKAETAGVEAVFTSDRASEDVREYFAEAVEAYLTFPGSPEGEIFRTDNSHQGLKNRNGELYDYIGMVLHQDYSKAVIPPPPPRPVHDPGIPDPDSQVFWF